MTTKNPIQKYTDKEALDFHIEGKPGKIEIISSKKPLNPKRFGSCLLSGGSCSLC